MNITVAPGNRVSAHVDRYSPCAKLQPDDARPRYSLHRITAHSITGMAADAVGSFRTGAAHDEGEPPRVRRGGEGVKHGTPS